MMTSFTSRSTLFNLFYLYGPVLPESFPTGMIVVTHYPSEAPHGGAVERPKQRAAFFFFLIFSGKHQWEE